MKYQTKDGQDYSIPGIGRTVNGVIVTDRIIENSNFELVEDEPAQAPQTVTPPAPALAPPLAPPSVPQPAPASPAPQTNQGSTI